ncbi:hypothetical protein UK23_38925 [Lentzea aerocolonigenes]|uniref:Uncharacterized protein n=1 Tax=Lentzea aerocolonigenes TaxID=68170 RepID=A0A0F0GFB4_LENAE|nr:hypothetical protein [Lentzea aerocolonigenes]KJK42060.1 hypothetical protein UK23_38925 [Lentzea aerocolonigenes]
MPPAVGRLATVRLATATAACAALIGATAGPAQADPLALEATAALYSFQVGDRTESLVVESGRPGDHNEFRQSEHASGRTTAHPGWDIRLSDDATAPAWDYAIGIAGSNHDGDGVSGSSSWGTLSLVDEDPSGLPFAVIQAEGGVTCDSKTGEIWSGNPNPTRFQVRRGGQLVDVTPNSGPLTLDDVTPGDRTGGSPARTTVSIVTVSDVDQLTGHQPFAKYADRARTAARGHALVIRQQPDPAQPPTTYRLLTNTTAASC